MEVFSCFVREPEWPYRLLGSQMAGFCVYATPMVLGWLLCGFGCVDLLGVRLNAVEFIVYCEKLAVGDAIAVWFTQRGQGGCGVYGICKAVHRCCEDFVQCLDEGLEVGAGFLQWRR